MKREGEGAVKERRQRGREEDKKVKKGRKSEHRKGKRRSVCVLGGYIFLSE